MKNSIQKLKDRIKYLESQATFAEAGDVAKLTNFVVTIPQAVVRIRKGVASHRPHNRRRLLAYAHNCHRHAKALRKIAKNYVFRPGVLDSELVNKELRPTGSVIHIDHGDPISRKKRVTGYK